MPEEEEPEDEVLDEVADGKNPEEEPEEQESEKSEGPDQEPEDEAEDSEEPEPEEAEQVEEEVTKTGRGEKIGELTIDLDRSESEDELFVYQVNISVEGEENSFELARYDTHLGWIEAFGVPPFNEWVLLDDFSYVKKNFSGTLNDEMRYSETAEIEEKGVSGYRLNLQRISGDEEEYYNTRIVDVPAESGKVSLTECMSSRGVYTDTVREKIYENVKPEGIPGITDYEEEYAENIVEKQGEPSVIVVKKAQVDGPTPAIYRKLFPFWDTEDFDEMPLRSIELGYLDRGDNDSDIDEKYGDWFKLFTFPDFDYRFLEIKEEGYTSTEVELGDEKVTTKQHYEKKLYSYTPEVTDDEGNED
jgi:hypothetical protein